MREEAVNYEGNKYENEIMRETQDNWRRNNHEERK